MREETLAYRFIGAGSNLVLSNEPFDGVYIIPRLLEKSVVDLADYQAARAEFNPNRYAGRYAAEANPTFLQMVERPEIALGELAAVCIGAGVPWGQAVLWSFDQGMVGLEWYARIPCAVGGAVFNAIHAESHLLAESVLAVYAISCVTGEERMFNQAELDIAYDHSRFHVEREWCITSVVFALRKAESAMARSYYLERTKEKTRVQPSGANCGSVFQNLQEPIEGKVAAAWCIDQAGLKGLRHGALQVYPGHANFILNHGGATQAELVAFLDFIRKTVHQKFSIWLVPEVECVNAAGQSLVWQDDGGYTWKK